jgi:hypothetical protein
MPNQRRTARQYRDHSGDSQKDRRQSNQYRRGHKRF